MKDLLAAIIGIAVAACANPAMAYVAVITTSMPAASTGDKAQLEQALESAVDDVVHHAMAMRVSLAVGLALVLLTTAA